MIESLLNNLPATVAGAVALFCLIAYPLCRSRHGILLMQLGASLGFAAHYALLGIFAASTVNVLGSVQTAAALRSGQSRLSSRIGYALIPLMVLAGAWFWTGWLSALSVIAMALIAIGRMQQRQWLLRSLLLAGCTMWTVHDFLVGAWIAFAADIGCWITGVAGLLALFFRIRIERRPRHGDAAALPAGRGLAPTGAG